MILVSVFALFVFGANVQAAVNGGGVCNGLTGRAFTECMQEVEKILKEQQGRQKIDPQLQIRKVYVWVSSPFVERSYGYWVGDLAEVVWKIGIRPEVKEIDLLRLPGIGARLGSFVIRERVIEDVAVNDARRVTIRYVVQNFAVLCEHGYVEFGPLEVLWRKRADAEWKRTKLQAAKILVSPISLCEEVPDVKMAPREMIPFSRLGLASIVTAAGATIILAALVILGLAILAGLNRIQSSPLYRARRNLNRRGITPQEAVKEFRQAIRLKFDISGSDSGEDVREKISAYRSGHYVKFADQAAHLWEATLQFLYEEHQEAASLIESIRTFITNISRREAEEK
jgi:hypothetical protein